MQLMLKLNKNNILERLLKKIFFPTYLKASNKNISINPVNIFKLYLNLKHQTKKLKINFIFRIKNKKKCLTNTR